MQFIPNEKFKQYQDTYQNHDFLESCYDEFYQPADGKKLLPFFIGNPFRDINFLSFVSLENLESMQQGAIFPCICITSESWNLFETFGKRKSHCAYYQIVDMFSKYNIPESHIHWLLNDCKIHEKIKTLKNNSWIINSKFYHINAFVSQIGKLVNSPTPLFDKEISYHYLSLAEGKPRHHRYALTCLLDYYDLLKYGRVSCSSYDNFYYIWTNTTQTEKNIDTDRYIKKFGLTQNDIERFKTKLPMQIDGLNNTNNFIYDQKTLYDKTFLSIVNETHQPSDDNIFITEKTYKAILHCKPFVINGDRHSLKYLKSLGFKTFSLWIDESYDESQNDWEKINKIIKIIQILSSLSIQQCYNLYKDMLPVLEYNYNLLKTLGLKELKSVSEQIDDN